MLTDSSDVQRAFRVLAAQLEASASEPVEIVVIGGAALNVLGFVNRATRDVDILALTGPSGELVKSRPLPERLVAAADAAGRALGLPQGWLNAGPADLIDCGLPEGFMDRLVARRYGPALLVHFASRQDLIAMKVYAAADSGPGRHTGDLVSLAATPEELLAGARWARTQDDSEEFRSMLVELLRWMGANAQAERLEDDA